MTKTTYDQKGAVIARLNTTEKEVKDVRIRDVKDFEENVCNNYEKLK